MEEREGMGEVEPIPYEEAAELNPFFSWSCHTVFSPQLLDADMSKYPDDYSIV